MTFTQMILSALVLGASVFAFFKISNRSRIHGELTRYRVRKKPIFVIQKSPNEKFDWSMVEHEKEMLERAGNKYGYNQEPVPVIPIPYLPNGNALVSPDISWEHYLIRVGEEVRNGLTEFSISVSKAETKQRKKEMNGKETEVEY